MRNTLVKAIILAAVSSLLFACGGGSDPMAQALDHQVAMLDILEKNKDNPEEAGNKLEEYQKANADAFKAIKEAAEKMKDQSPEDLIEMMSKHKGKIQEITEKTKKLMEGNSKLFANEKVQKAMAAMGGM